MIQIKELTEMIAEELDDAEKYAIQATTYKTSDKQLSDMYRSIARDELKHADAQHDQAVRLIGVAKQSGLVIPDVMQEIFDWEHKRFVSKKAKITSMME